MYSKALLILGTAMIAVFMLMMILVVVKSFESAPAEPIIERADLQQTIPNGPALKSILPINEAVKSTEERL